LQTRAPRPARSHLGQALLVKVKAIEDRSFGQTDIDISVP